MMGMKVSVNIPGEDLEFLDAYAQAHSLRSRSAAVQRAIGALRLGELGAAYQQAWEDWDAADDAGLWDSAAGDGA
jgi:predicted transcriptional regulator